MTTGALTWVEVRRAGGTLATPAAAGDETLVLDLLVDFDDDGGRLSVGGADYAYLGADHRAGVLTLAEPLAMDASAGDPVWVVEAGGETEVDRVAWVDLGEGDPVPAAIPTSLRPYFQEGAEHAGQLVEIELLPDVVTDSSVTVSPGYRVVSRPGQEPAFDAETLDPATIPDPVPAEPPEFSPSVRVSGYAEGLVIYADQVAPTTLIQYHIARADFGDADALFTPTAQTAWGEPTRSTVVVVNTEADGSRMVLGVPYRVRAVAVNAAGAADPGTQASAVLDKDAVATVIVAELAAGFILTGRIQVGAMVLDANEGLVIPGIMSIPVDGVSLPQMLMKLLAVGATFTGTVDVNDLMRVSGVARLTSGAPDPASEPQVTRTWSHVRSAEDQRIWDTYRRGLAPDINGTHWLYALAAFGGQIQVISRTTGTLAGAAMLGSTFWPEGGIVRVGAGDYFVLGYDTDRSSRWFVRRYRAADLVYLGEWEFANTGSMPFKPAIGTDGTNVIVARARGEDNRVRVWTLNKDTGAVLSTVDTDTAIGADLGSVVVGQPGAGWFAGNRIILATRTGAIRVFTTAGVRVPGEEWPTAGNATVRGMVHDGTRWHHLDADGRVWRYTTQATDQATDVAYAWYGTGAPTDETRPSQRRSVTWSRGSGLAVDTPPPPDAADDDDTHLHRANQVRVYAGPSGGALRLQATLPVGATSVDLEALDTSSTSARTTNGFPAGESTGRLESTTGGFWVDGASGGSIGTGGFRDSVLDAVAAEFGL